MSNKLCMKDCSANKIERMGEGYKILSDEKLVVEICFKRL